MLPESPRVPTYSKHESGTALAGKVSALVEFYHLILGRDEAPDWIWGGAGSGRRPWPIWRLNRGLGLDCSPHAGTQRGSCRVELRFVFLFGHGIVVKRVLIVEDTPEFQDALAELLGSMTHSWQVYSFVTGQAALNYVKETKMPVDLALVDLGLPDMTGAHLIGEIHDKWPEVPIVVISVFTNAEKVFEAIRAGAIGYLVKSDAQAIKRGIDQVMAGEFPISPMVARHLIKLVAESTNSRPSAPPGSPLSPQEHRLLQYIADGLSYAETAQAMDLSLSTVQTYSRNLFRKLDVHSKTQAIVKARGTGLLA